MARKIRVIIFKADNRGRAQIQKILEAKEFEVIAFDNPEQCPLQTAHECQCADSETCADILISDMDMPRVSGLDFIEKQISRGCKAQNIALMSATWESENIRRAEQLGCTIFEKPTRKSILEDWLDACEQRIDRKTRLSDRFIK